MKTITAAACTAVLIGASAAAQPADRSTFVTFSGPVSIPGKTLPPGTYTFRLADSPADRHIVQIFNREQTDLIATLLAVPAERNEAEGDPLITFRETPSNMPPAVRYWYYAGEKSGNEFVYPKAQAIAIARASGEGVMSMDTESTNVSEWTGTPTRVTANAEPAASTATTASTASTTTQSSTAQPTTTPAEPTSQPTTAQPTATQPTTQPTSEPAATQPTTSQPVTTQPTTAAPDQPAATSPRSTTADRPTGTSGRAEPSELPRTAGELPAAGLIALFAFAGAVALRVARRPAV